MDLVVLVILGAFLCVFYLQLGKIVTELGEIKHLLQNQRTGQQLEDIGQELASIAKSVHFLNARDAMHRDL